MKINPDDYPMGIPNTLPYELLSDKDKAIIDRQRKLGTQLRIEREKRRDKRTKKNNKK